jgi:hypothetical protein
MAEQDHLQEVSAEGVELRTKEQAQQWVIRKLTALLADACIRNALDDTDQSEDAEYLATIALMHHIAESVRSWDCFASDGTGICLRGS